MCARPCSTSLFRPKFRRQRYHNRHGRLHATTLGRDVSATWKLLVAIVLAPALWLSYTAAAAAIAGLEMQRPWTVEVRAA